MLLLPLRVQGVVVRLDYPCAMVDGSVDGHESCYVSIGSALLILRLGP